MKLKNMFKKENIAIVLILAATIFLLGLAVVFMFLKIRATTDKIDALESRIEMSGEENEDSEEVVAQIVKGSSSKIKEFGDIIFNPKLELRTLGGKYNFSDMKTTPGTFSNDNDMWFAHWCSPYLSPGMEYDIYLRGDDSDLHWVYCHVINTDDKDVSAADCTAFTVGIKGLEDLSICGIKVGDSMDSVMECLGVPDEVSVSDYDAVSRVMYDYGDFTLSVQGDILVGDVDYIELKCTDTRGYSNGKIR